MANRLWTAAEKRVLTKSVARGVGYKFIADRLGRSVCAVQQQARALKMSARRGSAEWRARISRSNKGKRRSPRTEFGKGNRPWNKGRKGLLIHPNCAKGWFRKGCLAGKARLSYRPVGTVTIHKHKGGRGACRWIKVRDDGAPARRWIPFARFRWERLHGPVPRGMFVVHGDGNTMNEAPDNLLLMDRKHLPAWQRSVRPKMEERRKKRGARATRDRWAVYRARKARREEHEAALRRCG